MKTEELRKLDVKSLKQELRTAQQAHFAAKFKVASGESNNTAVIKREKIRVARIKTVIREKQIEQEMENSLEKSEQNN